MKYKITRNFNMNRSIGFLFDLDGVIIDSESEYTRIWETIEERFPTGIPSFALKIKGQTLTKILDDNYRDPEIRKEVEIMLHDLEKAMRYYYCEGAERLITYLISEAIPRAIVTSSDEHKMAHLYQDIPDFKSNFTKIIDSTYVTRSKPDPEGYLRGAQYLQVSPERCAVFEDSVQGVKAGRAAGALVIGVIGTKTREELEPWCDIMVESLTEIDPISIIKILNSR